MRRLGSLLTLWMSSLLAHLGSGELWVVCSSSTLGGEAIDITAKSVSILDFFMSHASPLLAFCPIFLFFAVSQQCHLSEDDAWKDNNDATVTLVRRQH